MLIDTTATEKINYEYIMVKVGKLDTTSLSDCINCIIKSDVIVPAGEQVNIDVRVWISDNVLNSEIGKSFYAKLKIDGLAIYNEDKEFDNSNLEAGIINKPNLDTGLIPVYYDETAVDSDGTIGAWRKADSNNLNNSWYDYNNKKWANAIMIADDSLRDTYQKASVNTLIPISDITAFYVWIPRYKYRVWNINRQIGDESTYAYSAYTNGIEIKFEFEDNSTGNIDCNYDITDTAFDTSLSDVCVYDNTDTITTTSVNSNYQDAWYTHPAFTFGGEEKTGFWVGKFETSGTATAPMILPDRISLNNQNISNDFKTTKIFQSYGLSTNVDAHMLKNLEWGAVAYLAHSKYGLCNEGACRDSYVNNSSSMYTGRSAGVLSAVSSFSKTGTYDYKGYTVGNNTIERDESKVASTTGNIYGIYDMSGGTWEYVMGNMLSSSYNVSSWNGDPLDSKYYDAYPHVYGGNSNAVGGNQRGYNRSRLGDATAEVKTMVGNDSNCWYERYCIMVFLYTVSTGDGDEPSNNVWFYRGGNYHNGYSSVGDGLFQTRASNGETGVPDGHGNTFYFTFRASIS